MEGQVAGTPLYMAPEQARGQIDKLDQRTDVYGLGAILYRLLARQSYLSGKDVHTILELVKTATPLPPHRVRGSSLRVPRELSAICMKALAKEQSDRYQTVQAMIDDLERFERGLPVSVYRPPLPARLLKFCRRHPLVGMVVVTAVSLGVVIMVTGTAVRYQRHLGMLSSARSYKEKGDQAIGLAMAIQDRLNHLRAKQRLKTATIEEGALAQRLETLRKNSDSNYDIARLLYAQAMEFGRAPGFDLLGLLRRGKDGDSSLGISEERLLPICQEVVDTYRRQIDCALLGGDYAETQRLFELMQPWYLSTPGNYSMDFHYWRAQTRKFLEGYGSLKVEIDVPDAEIAVYRLAGDLSPPNLDRPDLRGAAQLPVGALPHGSYLVTITAEGYPTVTVPVAIEHAEERAIRLSVPRDLPDDMAYVPSGPTIVGGPASPLYRQKEIWLPGFLMKRHEVTMAEYLEFWLSLETNADREACMAYVQFSEGAYSKTPSWNERGEITHPLTPQMPIVGISKAAADAYCAWLAARLGREVRLPTADEWEKAARGADGRIYPWGNGFRSDYAHLEETQDGIGVDIYAEPGSYPMDCSVYGILDLGGNVREWTATPFPDSPRRFQIKGGSLATSRRHAASAYADMTPAIPTDVGFRYIMPLDDAEQ
jgi:formylglycine-generating enzyme required for sulfatase activity